MVRNVVKFKNILLGQCVACSKVNASKFKIKKLQFDDNIHMVYSLSLYRKHLLGTIFYKTHSILQHCRICMLTTRINNAKRATTY